MFGTFSYHSTLKNIIIAFGSMFSQILVERFDANGNLLQQLKVPILYGPREKYLARIDANPDLKRQIDQLLPRMSFEITSITYDQQRKLNTLGKKRASITGSTNLSNVLFSPVPYNLTIQLSVMTRNQDDGCQIVEQILPYFTPDWTLQLNLIPEMNEHRDIPFILTGVSCQDTYEGNFEERRAIIWTLDFTCKAFFYGPVKKTSVILTANTDFFSMDDTTVYPIASGNTGSITANTSKSALLTAVTPGLSANGQPTSNASLTVAANTISSNANYGIITANTSPTPGV